MKSITGKITKTIVLITIGAVIGLGGQLALTYQHQLHDREHFASRDSRPASQVGGLSSQQYQQLAAINFHSGQSPVFQVNGGRSTLNPKSWRDSHVVFQQLDGQSRTSRSNTAFLTWRNHANTALRSQQTVAPAGWHNNRNGLLVYNRGHLIAYSLTGGIDQQTGEFTGSGANGDQNNPRNIFTETDFTNQAVQTIYEGKVRRAIEGHHRVIYQVTPIFRGSELMPRGINLQAIATDGTLNFNVYLANVEPGIRFDYQTGDSISDPTNSVAVPLDPEGDTMDDKEEQRDDIQTVGHYQRPVASQPRHYRRVIN